MKGDMSTPASGERQCADDRPKDSPALAHALRQMWHQPAFVVVDPGLTTRSAYALESGAYRRAVFARALQFQRPAGAADCAGQKLWRRLIDLERAPTELKVTE